MGTVLPRAANETREQGAAANGALRRPRALSFCRSDSRLSAHVATPGPLESRHFPRERDTGERGEAWAGMAAITCRSRLG